MKKATMFGAIAGTFALADDFEKTVEKLGLYPHGTRDKIALRKYKLGDLCVGHRAGSVSHLRVGVLVDAYVTVNGIYRNPAYVLECVDGKRRVYQCLRKIELANDSKDSGRVLQAIEERLSYLKLLEYAKQDAKEQAIQNDES